MLYAKDKAMATPGARSQCPVCDGELIAKCGEIVCWHWAHVSADCDPWAEPETEWHVKWKNCFPLHMQEVVVASHRADVLIGTHAIEFQHSPISSSEIRDRENHYDVLTWVLDGSEFRNRFRLSRPLLSDGSSKQRRWLSNADGWWCFNWSHARQSWLQGVEIGNVVIDLGHMESWGANGDYPTLVLVEQWNTQGEGRGRFICRNSFVEICLNNSFRIHFGRPVAVH